MYLKKAFLSLLRQNTFLPYLILFELAFLLFYFIQSSLTFPDPDSFYHVKMALLMRERGFIRDFPWLEFTILKDYYTDHHLLYHIFLIPFVSFFPPLLGTKFATILFSSLAIVSFYWLLKKFEVRGAWFYVFVLMTSASFIFRLNLVKAQALALIFYFIGFALIDQRKYLFLAFFSFLYVWLYGGWPLIILLAGVHMFSGIISQFHVRKKHSGSQLKNVFFYNEIFLDRGASWQWVKREYKVFLYILGGTIGGIVLNPYFPKNLFFYWQQIVQIAIVNYRGLIGVGSEWYPYNVFDLMASASVAFIVFLVGLSFFVLTFPKHSTRSLMLFLLSLIFFILTLRSRRNVEYLIPTILLFSAVALTIFSKHVDLKIFFKEVLSFLWKQRVLFISALLPMILVPYVMARDVLYVRNLYKEGQEFDKFEKPSKWLIAHSRPESIVFHSDWDEFPILFYHNTHNRYIVGLDPTFMYNYNPNLYEKFKRVTLGEEVGNLYSIVKNDFRAEYVFISLNRHEKMDKNLKNNFLFEEVYKDEEVKIYKVL